MLNYSLRPAVWRGRGGRYKNPISRCYLPHSWPVYRLQRLVSVAVCLVALLLVCLVAFVLLQVSTVTENRRAKVGISWLDLGITNGTHDAGRSLLNPGKSGHEEDLDLYDDYSSDSDMDEDEYLLVLSDDDYEYQEEDEDDYNPEFDMSYFDFSIKEDTENTKTSGSKKQEILKEARAFETQDAKNTKTSGGQKQNEEHEGTGTFRTPIVRIPWVGPPLPSLRVVNDRGLEIVKDGFVFSPALEAKLQDQGFTDESVGRILWQLRTHAAAELQDPTWDRCGRPMNQWVKFSGGMAACARYRYPDDHLLLGELLSFYLARLLSVSRVLPTTLARPDHPRWAPVAPQMERAGWGAASVVVLTPWLSALVRDQMPASLHHALMTNSTLGASVEDRSGWKVDEKQKGKTGETHKWKSNQSLRDVPEGELVRLLQWSDLVVFDFLTANYDRVAYMLDAAEEEGRPEVMTGNVHNLVRNKNTGGLWLLDNESGVVDGYSLLYGRGDSGQAARFASFHRRLLHSICVFRRSTIEAVVGLSRHPNPHEVLVRFARDHEPLLSLLPDPLNHHPFIEHFKERLVEVEEWMAECVRRAGISLRQ